MNKQRGFTLIELLVVVSILAAIAGVTATAIGSYDQDAREQLVRVEMKNIAKAIRRFREDTGYWPKTGPYDYIGRYAGQTTPTDIDEYVNNYYAHESDFRFLFYLPERYVGGYDIDNLPSGWGSNNTPISQWEPDYGLGWNGPYIDIPAAREVIATAANCHNFGETEMDALLDPYTGYPATQRRRSIGIVDRFERDWQSATYNNFCVTVRDQGDRDQYIGDRWSGSPYLYITDYSDSSYCSSPDCIVIQSFGFDGQRDTDDDVVVVLQENR